MHLPSRVRLLVVLVVAEAAHAQSGQFVWRSRSAAQFPPARYTHAVAYDSARGKTLLFGGLSTSGTPLSDTWEWDGTVWVQRSPSTSPPRRFHHAMANDSAHGMVVLFGGHDGNNALADTWEWDGTTWTQRAPAANPLRRYDHALAYDSGRNRVVLFGGYGPDVGRFADTWEWDGSTWTQRFVGGFPPARSQHALAYDSARQLTVLFGGYDSTSRRLADTWEWNGTGWIDRTTPNSPPAMASHALAYSVVPGRTVLFEGEGGLGDTWEWDGMAWARRLAACGCPCLPVPAPRYRHALAYDASRQRTVLFGGYPARNDTWEYQSASQPPPCSTLGLGHCSGSLEVTCASTPRIGSNFCLNFTNPGLPAGFNLLYISIPPIPALQFNSPALCSVGYLYAFPPIIVLEILGNPANFCLGVPNEPVLVGQTFGFQGGSFEAASCFRLTDGLAVTVQP